MSASPNLQMSDLASGVLCVAYDVMQGKSASVNRFVEQVVYRVGGRKVAELSTLKLPTSGVVSDNHIYTSVLSGADGKMRKNHTLNGVGVDMVRAGGSSLIADYSMSALGITDKVLI